MHSPITDLETVVRRHQAGVWRYVRLLGVDPADADDLTQEVFLVLVRRGFRGHGDDATWSFLRQTARHLVLRRRRAFGRARVSARADLVDEVLAEGPDPASGLWTDALRVCLERLEGRARQAIHLFYREGLGRSEVARRLAMKQTGVKTLLQRTRAALRRCILDQSPGGRP